MEIKILEETKIVSIKIEGETKRFAISKINSFLGSKFYLELLRKEGSPTFVKKPSVELITEIVKSAFGIGEEEIKIEY